ncbi:PPC domain-containing protein [Xanthomonas axonopodis pv. cyamopsidis]|nr:PPC domain-containing protein [Xanthomonas euvesicatoria]MBV6776581.1 PPC domain-containing protein [Xanthomonas campestris pv. carissae]
MIVPAGAKVLSFITYGGTGDVSVYASQSTRPTPTDYQQKSTRAGNSETVRFMAPAPGTYYVLVKGVKAFSTTLMATWSN